jgi:hypothetical protein
MAVRSKKFTPEIDAQLYDENGGGRREKWADTKRHVLEQALRFYLENLTHL